jgi:hypothetical protein
MTNKTRTVTLASAFAAAGVCRIDAAATRPFGVVLEASSYLMASDNPCVQPLTDAGAGRASHMGTIAWAGTQTLDFCGSPEGVADHGEFVITAANGDEVSGSYDTLVRFDFDAGVFTFAGTWRISGGTGRFSHATGIGTVSGGGAIQTSRISATMAGSISY